MESSHPGSRIVRFVSGLRVGQVLGFSIGGLFVLAVVGIGLALAANASLNDRRALVVDQIAPAQLAVMALENTLSNQDTGVHSFLTTRRRTFLSPYYAGLMTEAGRFQSLRALLRRGASAPYLDQLGEIGSAEQAWRESFVKPLLDGSPAQWGPIATISGAGNAHFDAVRRVLGQLSASLASERGRARVALSQAARQLKVTLALAGALILAGLLGAGVLLRRVVTAPLERLGAEARRVAGGDFATALVGAGGAREIVEVGGDVDAMRERIVAELAAVQAAGVRLEEQARELQRSNTELEQFAYVASHDLQEPLRKVASFCQALEQRYHGQLDARADQYIEFAVDGAKRMQILINDLLAFSRVGHSGRESELLEAAELVADARSSLSTAIEEAHAEVVVSDLPVVRGDRTLLVSVFRNLIANAVKFRGSERPVVRIEAHRANDDWEFSCSDNGIGIDAGYAERIFVIFQRLHPKEAYPGTGIGLAMCRKIIENYGGRIWLDTEVAGGTCLRFTLPVPVPIPEQARQ